MTRQDALSWLYSEDGGSLDFDGIYGSQCVDYFNYYYQFLTGRSPYWDGYGVDGAKDLWNVPTDRFAKILNNTNDPNQLPDIGDILIYNGTWGGGYGHVEMVLSADQNGVNVSAQNSKGQYVAMEFRSWGKVTRGLIGWMSFNGFAEEQPTPPVIINDPLPPVVPEAPIEPTLPEPEAPAPIPEVPTVPEPPLPPVSKPEEPVKTAPKPRLTILAYLLGQLKIALAKIGIKY